MLLNKHCLISLLVITTITMVTSRKSDKSKKSKKENKAPRWRGNSDPVDKTNRTIQLEGATMVFRCRAYGRPRVSIQWFKNGLELGQVKQKKIRIKKHNLIVRELQPSDSGMYMCKVSNSLGQIRWSHELVVTQQKREFHKPINKTIIEGELTRFFCGERTKENYTVLWEWEENGRINTQVSQYKGPNRAHYLDIMDTDFIGLRKYTCMIRSKRGVKRFSAWLEVLPRKTSKPTTTTPTTTTRPTTTTTTTTTSSTTTTTTLKTTSTSTVQITEAKTFRLVTRLPTQSEQRRHYFLTTNSPRKMISYRRPYRRKGDHKRKRKKKQRNRKGGHRKKQRLSIKRFKNTRRPYKTRLPTTVPNIFQFDPQEPKHRTFNPIGQEILLPKTKKPNLFEQHNGDSRIDTQSSSSFSPAISLWTIYVIVGSVAGGILLIGLVTIIIAVLCHRTEENDFKSTTV